MDVSLIEKNTKENKATFLVKNASFEYINALRRFIIDRVPTMAIEEAEIVKNNSALYDEIVAHRLGLVALSTDLESYNLPKDCKCSGKGCARCQVQLTLKKEGPGLVTADKMKSKDPKIKPVFGQTPVVKLLEGQEIEIVATAQLGTGKEHAKWSPGHVYYHHNADIKVNDKKVDESAKEWVKQCPYGILDYKSKKVVVNKDKVNECTLCNACVDNANGAITVTPDTKSFVLTIESWGQLDISTMVTKAVDQFDKVLDEFVNSVKAL